MPDSLIPSHGGYRKLKSFQLAQLAYDLTVSFVEHYIPRNSRTCDQMVQAARSGVQNIAEGSLASGTSKKTELKLTNVARASLEELRLDYEDFLRQRGYSLWQQDDPREAQFTEARCKTLEDVKTWVNGQRFGQGLSGQRGPSGRSGLSGQALSRPSIKSRSSTPVPEIAANAALILIRIASALLDRQLARLASDFEKEGGFTERLCRTRYKNRNLPHHPKLKESKI